MITKAITFTIVSLFISGCVGTMKIAEDESKKDLTPPKSITTKNAKPQKTEEVKKEVKKNKEKEKK